jgi:hypothetical protein
MSPTPVADSPAPERSRTMPEPGRARRGPSAASVWLRVALACALLGVAGGLRTWQERRVEASLISGLDVPFPLADLPMQVGDWAGRVDVLDPRIAQATGSVDSTLRTYLNQRTGVRLEVIVLYGPAASMRIHAPEACYPAAGFAQAGGAGSHEVAAGEDRPAAQFRSLIYTKGEGGQAVRQEVYYAWRYDGRWTPHIGVHKQVERIPSMIKVQVSRPVAEGELRDAVNPCRDFLEALVPEIERRLEASTGPAAPARPAA